MKRIFALVLLVTLTIALISAAGLVVAGKTVTVDPEIIRAISYRFVPKALQRNYDQQITYWEMCKMLTNLITHNHKEALSKWEESAKLALGETSLRTYLLKLRACFVSQFRRIFVRIFCPARSRSESVAAQSLPDSDAAGRKIC